MRRVFFVAGIVVILLGIIGFLALLLQPVTAICVGISLILSGAMMLVVSDLLGRVAYLEEQLEVYAPAENDPDLPQRKCSACGKSFDFDYPACPYCGKREN
ncbi:MAG: hypothetical protein IJZ02_02625 [Clostridia bacterium]|nr:hypothetical protein [Clostridia bacterium]